MSGAKGFFARLFENAGYRGLGGALDVAPSAEDYDTVDLGPGVSGPATAYYSGWTGSASGGDGSDWRYGLSSSGSTPVLDHTLLRLNARAAYHDSLQGKAIVDRFADLVPGTGLKLEATPDVSALGIEPDAAEEWAQKVEADFDAFMRSKEFTLSEDMTGYQTQRFVTTQQQRDGEYFARLHYGNRDGLNPLQVSFLDPTQIQGYPMTDTAGYAYLDQGIEHDEKGREVAYNVVVTSPKTGKSEQKRLRRFGALSGRPLMLHGFQREYPGQTRGYSRIGHLVQKLEKLTTFEYSHLMKAINESMVPLWIKPSKDNPASGGGLEDLKSSAANVWDDPDNPKTAGDVSARPSVDLSELNEVNGRPGSWFHMGLSEGEELRTLDGKTPSEHYSTFVDAFVKSLSASVSMPSEVVWMQFGESFSASRAALVLAWQVIEIWRAELAADFLNPIYEQWLAGEIAAGRIVAPGWSDKRMRRAWTKNNWIGFPMPNIDPSKIAKATQLDLAIGATTMDRVARERNGSAGKSNRAKLVRELSELPPVVFGKDKLDSNKEDSREGSDE